MNRLPIVTLPAALLVAPLAASAAEKYDAGTFEGRGASVTANVGSSLAPRLLGKPVVVRIHADWCPACKQTEPMLAAMKRAYGDRVTFITYDVTNAKTAARASADAKADGLAKFYDATKAATSTVAVIDAKTGAVVAELYNDIEEADYTQAIERALKGTK